MPCLRELIMKCTLLSFSKRNHNMSSSKGNLNVEDGQLIHPSLQRARNDLLRGTVVVVRWMRDRESQQLTLHIQ